MSFNKLVLGETHFLLNGTALLNSNLLYDAKSSTLKCNRCRAVIGLAQSERNGVVRKKTPPTTGSIQKQNKVRTLKVFKHSVKLPVRHKNGGSGDVGGVNGDIQVQYG